jgi:hypothetical protein
MTLLHELQHTKLAALMGMLRLHQPAAGRLYYAPWRDDPRPLGALLHGTYAHLGIALFWERQRVFLPAADALVAEIEFARWSRLSAEACTAILASGELTAAGHEFVSAIDGRLNELLSASLTSRARRLADQLELDHRVAWRCRNLEPDAETVGLITERWMTGSPPPAGTSLPSARRARPLPWVRPRRREALYAHLRGHPFPETHPPLPLPDPDSAYIRGDYASAMAGYVAAISDGHPSIERWGGIALGAAELAAGSPESSLMSNRPEYIAAITDMVRARTGRVPDIRAWWHGWLLL